MMMALKPVIRKEAQAALSLGKKIIINIGIKTMAPMSMRKAPK